VDKVSDFMTKDVIHIIGKSASVQEAAQKMREVHGGCLIVVEKGQPAGIVTERDLVGKVIAENLSPKDLKVSEVMSKPVITIGPEASISAAAKVMVENRIRRLVVTEGNRTVGVLTVTDFAKLLYQRSAHDPVLAAMARAALLG